VGVLRRMGIGSLGQVKASRKGVVLIYESGLKKGKENEFHKNYVQKARGGGQYSAGTSLNDLSHKKGDR